MTQFKQFSNITINGWINLSTLSQYTIVSSGEFKISYPDDGNGFLFEVVDSNDNTFTVRSGLDPNTGSWYMLTLVYDQSELRGYVNSGTSNTVSANGNSLTDSGTGIEFGGIDGKGQEFRIYDSALTESEIEGLYDVVDTPGTLVSSKKQL